MARFLHTVAVEQRNVAVSTTEAFDLPVNPLSVILLRICPLLNTAGTPINAKPTYLELCAMFSRVRVVHRGASIVSCNAVDLACLNYLRRGVVPRVANPDDNDNERVSALLPVFLGRFPYDMSSCFPASRRGELVLEVDTAASGVGFDNFAYGVETIELLEGRPREYERISDISRTFTATGFQDIELPLGNRLRGLQLFGTTDYTGAAPAPSWGRISLRRDNQETHYSDIDWETAVDLSSLLGRQPPALDIHTHRVDATSASTVQETGRPLEQGMGGWNQRVFLDLDPTRDDTFSIDTTGAASVQLRANIETADACRVTLVERIGVGS